MSQHMDRFEALAAELMEEMKSLHRIKPQMDINEAFRGEAFILDYLASSNGAVQPSDIGQEMDVSSARIATALNSLEKKGLVTRSIDADDRRCILITLTENGKAAARQHYQMVQTMVAKMLNLLGEDDAREYIRLQRRLAETLPCCQELIEYKG